MAKKNAFFAYFLVFKEIYLVFKYKFSVQSSICGVQIYFRGELMPYLLL